MSSHASGASSGPRVTTRCDHFACNSLEYGAPLCGIRRPAVLVSGAVRMLSL